AKLEDAPWNNYPRKDAISPCHLSKLLKPFGIYSDSVRIGEKTPKGYHRTQFEPHWRAYPLPEKRNSATSPVNIGENAGFEPQHQDAWCALENGTSPNNDGHCCVVAPSYHPETGVARESAHTPASPNGRAVTGSPVASQDLLRL